MLNVIPRPGTDLQALKENFEPGHWLTGVMPPNTNAAAEMSQSEGWPEWDESNRWDILEFKPSTEIYTEGSVIISLHDDGFTLELDMDEAGGSIIDTEYFDIPEGI